MVVSRQIRLVSRLLFVVTLVGAALLLSGTAAADTAIIDLGNLGSDFAGANGINDRGQIVGLSMTADWDMHAFLWQNGTMTDLGFFKPGDTIIANDINNRGQVVGFAYEIDDSPAWIWQKGVLAKLTPFPGGGACNATAINEAGAVVGYCWVAESGTHGFIWRDGMMTDLWSLGCQLNEGNDINARGDIVGGTAEGPAVCTSRGLKPLCFLAGDCGVANAINDRGQIAGTAGGHAILWSNGIVTDLGTLGGPTSGAGDINNKGQVVGTSETGTLDSPGPLHGFMWDGVMHDLGVKSGGGPYSTSYAIAINQRGDIVGVNEDSDMPPQHAVLWPARSR